MLRTLTLTGFFCLFFTSFLSAHGDLHAQIEKTSKHIEKNPDNPDLYLKRGQLYYQHGDFENAKNDLVKARLLKPKLHITDLLLAKVLSKSNKAELALQHANAFLSYRADDPDALITRAAIFRQLENKDAAKKDLESAFEHISTPRPGHYIAIAESILEADHANFEEALDWLEKGQLQFGFDIVLKEKEIQLLTENRQYQRALKATDDVLAQTPRKEKWLFRKGQIHEKANQLKTANTFYQATLEAIQDLPQRIQKTRKILELEALALQKTRSL